MTVLQVRSSDRAFVMISCLYAGYSANSANYLFLSYLDDASTLGSGDEREAFPVRCVKD